MKYTSEEIDRMKKFITPDLRPSYLLFKDKSEHPDKYDLQEEEASVKIKPRKFIVDYIEQFKDNFVKDK